MAGEATVDSYAAALNTLFGPDAPKTQFYQDHPFLAWLPKKAGFGGDGIKRLTQITGVPKGGGNTFADAQAAKGPSDVVGFQLPRLKSYQLWGLDNEAVAASKGKTYAVMELMKGEGDRALMALGNAISKNVHGNRGGGRGVISAISGSVLTLAAASDIVNFEIGMQLAASAGDGTQVADALRGAPDYRTISEIDQGDFETGATVTLSAAPPGSWAVDDTLFRRGDFKAGWNGLADWLPTDRTDAFLDVPFLSVVRSSNKFRLAGVFSDERGRTVLAGLRSLATKIVMNGGRPDTAFLNPLDMELVEIELDNTVVREEMVIKNPGGGSRGASVGFDTVVIRAGGRRIRLVEDVDNPRGVVRMLQRDTWGLYHLEGVPHMAREGMGQSGGRAEGAADAVEYRARAWANLGCIATGWNGVALVGSA